MAKTKLARKPGKKEKASPGAGTKTAAPAVGKSDLNALRKELLELRAKLVSGLDKDPTELTAADPGDDADVASQTYEKEMHFGIADSERETLMKIEDALRKINIGSYGLCDRCGKTIPLKRLRVLPYSRYCLTCQALAEIRS